MDTSKNHYQIKETKDLDYDKVIGLFFAVHFFLVADDDVVGFYEKSGFKLHKYGMYLEKGRKVCVIYN